MPLSDNRPNYMGLLIEIARILSVITLVGLAEIRSTVTQYEVQKELADDIERVEDSVEETAQILEDEVVDKVLEELSE